MLFNQHDRVFAMLLCCLVLLHHEVHIGVRAFLHLIRIVIRDRTFAAHPESLLQLVFAQGMSCCAFLRRFRLRSLELLLKPCRWCAVEPPG